MKVHSSPWEIIHDEDNTWAFWASALKQKGAFNDEKNKCFFFFIGQDKEIPLKP